MDKLESPHIFQAADEAGVVGEATWAEVFRMLERLKIKGIMCLLIALAFFFGMLWMFSLKQYLLGAISLALAGFYYRSYTGVYALYRNIYGRRAVVMPNLSIKG